MEKGKRGWAVGGNAAGMGQSGEISPQDGHMVLWQGQRLRRLGGGLLTTQCTV